MKARRNHWTVVQMAALYLRYPNERTGTLAASMGLTEQQVYNKARELGLRKSAQYRSSSDSTLLKQGNPMAFKPGNTRRPAQPWNKGKIGLPMLGRTTHFKPGHMPANAYPVGAERTAHGYLCRKVQRAGERPTWVPVHVLAYEAANGPLQPGQRVRFKDGNRANFDPSNLEATTNSGLIARNSVHHLPAPLRDVVRVRSTLTRLINQRSAA